MSANWETSAVATGLEKVSCLSNPKEGSAKEHSNYWTTVLILHASKGMLIILQARFQQYVNWELPDVQTGFRKGRRARDQIANIHWIIEKTRKFQKNIYFCFMDHIKVCVDHGKLENLWRDGNTRPPYVCPKKPVCRSISKFELDMEQWTGSKLGREYIKAIHCHPIHLTYMQSTSCEMQGWMNHKSR